ncbi:hypothetical protein CCACVL1_03844 [Corchorus capsularis]|uniref:Uncharacterized protein n=1 Tax=Corchorus capsularis TaxID=210143 RepID=A0A1R3JX35_COCAP|nr:hypothetical protein CCACVL1_03844 [Corchorus capsularis]
MSKAPWPGLREKYQKSSNIIYEKKRLVREVDGGGSGRERLSSPTVERGEK